MKTHSARWIAIAALLGLASGAQAVPTLHLTADGGATISCADQDFSCDKDATLGSVTFIGSLGSFSVNVTTGLTKPSLPSPGLMDLDSIDVQSTSGTHTLSIGFSETGFVDSAGLTGLIGGVLTAPAGSHIDANAYFDPANNLFALTTPIGTGLSSGPGAFSGTFAGAEPGVTPYSLTEIIGITFTGRGSFSANFTVEKALPEPASLSLAALGLGLLGFSRRKRV